MFIIDAFAVCPFVLTLGTSDPPFLSLQRINYYDSMAGTGRTVTSALKLWLEDEDEDKNGDTATFEPDDWTIVGTDRATTPQQVRPPYWPSFFTANGSAAVFTTHLIRKQLWRIVRVRNASPKVSSEGGWIDKL